MEGGVRERSGEMEEKVYHKVRCEEMREDA